MATATAAEPELKTYWCHECDMSVALTWSPSPSLLCPHCHTHFLELMDSPLSQNDAESPPLPSALFDVVFQDALALLSPQPRSATSKTLTVPVIAVTKTLLSELDPNGVVLCAVCKDQICVDNDAKQLPCKHLYHSDCITPWLEQLHGSSCPLCRFPMREDLDDDGDGDGDGDDDDALSQSSRTRQLVVRLSELTEDDFYGLRTTLNHIASRLALLDSNNENRVQLNEPGDVAGESGC
ncbi:uncharacterized protein LOC133299573 [Gastrolobium bilobum]|uniref:uncharacterized protein LOC133299573 n=1 Tax=Gastrolobium bilobum TaxID=150636 RepID=UPI002AB0D552|nr:uncharacterized protein LOC133299573 [Gastrolobium bilobum]